MLILFAYVKSFSYLCGVFRIDRVMIKLPPHLQHLYDTKQYAALRSALEELAGDAFSRADWNAHDRIMKQLRALPKS